MRISTFFCCSQQMFFLWSHAPTRAENSPPGCFWSLLKNVRSWRKVTPHPSSFIRQVTWWWEFHPRLETPNHAVSAPETSHHEIDKSWQRLFPPGQGPRTPELNWLQDSRASWGFCEFYGIHLIERWSSSRIQPPKKKQLEKSQPSTYCVILWRQMNKCHRKKKEFSLTQLDMVAWNFRCDTVTHRCHNHKMWVTVFVFASSAALFRISSPRGSKELILVLCVQYSLAVFKSTPAVATTMARIHDDITNPYDLAEQMARFPCYI